MTEKVRFRSYIALFAVLGLSSYHLFLCYVHTHFFAVNNGIVGATEGLILIIATLKIIRNKPLTDYAVPAFVIAYFIIMLAVRDEIDPQGIRNLYIIYVMFCLGRTVPLRDMTIITWLVILLALVFSIFEYFFIDLYLQTFNILQYYAARGLVSDEQLGYLNTNLYTSGMRVSGRTILPFLGDQRVSSIFLEPVSMGNFSAVISMWALSYNFPDWKKSLGFYIAGAFFIIASDSRFASMLIGILFLIRFAPLLQKSLTLYLMPIITVAAQAYFASLMLVDSQFDDLPGRLAKSGNVLLDITLPEVFGIGSVDELYDMGIPYSLVVFGAPLCLFLWFKLVFLKFANSQGQRFKAMLAVYCLGLLLISGTSFYSAKTAGLLWLMMGTLYEYKRVKVSTTEISG
jgi:putative polymerase